ncbi:zinc-ribbon domain-containing protein [Herbaspirillum sp. GCM10030257]
MRQIYFSSHHCARCGHRVGYQPESCSVVAMLDASSLAA